MMESKREILVCFFFLSLCGSYVCSLESDTASFYGSSFLKLPLSETPLSNRLSHIQLEFRTSRAKALLVALIGEEDHIILRLKRGLLQAELKSGALQSYRIISKSRPKLDDLRWHSVGLTIYGNTIHLLVDGVLQREDTLPQRFENLITDSVLYIGGVEYDHEYLFLTSSDLPFRGCIRGTEMNNVDLYETIKTSQFGLINEVTWDCSSEFEARRDDPISLIRDDSFVSFPRWLLRTEGTIGFWVRTFSSGGLLLFNAGKRSTFISAELWKGRLRVLLNGQGDTVGILSSVIINDSTWHFIKIAISTSSIEISIDLVPETFELDQQLTFDLTGNLYIGGVVHLARLQALGTSLHSVVHPTSGGSYKGCLRDIEVDGEKLTLGDTEVTHGITVGCIYQFLCLYHQCNYGEVCNNIGIDEYECRCDSCPSITTPSALPKLTVTQSVNERGVTDSPQADSSFNISPLYVDEGSGTLITQSNLRLNIDLDEYDLRKSQFIFRVIQPAQYGVFESDVQGREDSSQFTLLDLEGRKISYVHDGSENFQDFVVLEVDVLGRKRKLPEALRRGVSLKLDIQINPVNDPPFIHISEDNSLKIIAYTKREIENGFLSASDPDTPPEDLVFSVISQPRSLEIVGYFELNDNPGEPVYRFTQSNIDKRELFYVHTGPQLKSRIVLRVSDGEEKSDIQSLRVEAAPLSMRISNLTLLKLNPQQSQLILPSHLNVVTNDPTNSSQITFHIQSPAQYGVVQRSNYGDWSEVTTFMQREVSENKIRFLASDASDQSSVVQDSLTLRATSGEATLEDIQFEIEIVVTKIDISDLSTLVLDEVRQVVITSQNLSATVTNPTSDSLITFEITRTPTQGSILKHPNIQLQVGDNFTKTDIAKGLISYKVGSQYEKSLEDSFLFFARLPNAQTEVHEMTVMFIPRVQPLNVQNADIYVREGESVTFTPSSLYVSSKDTEDFTFQLTHYPMHGMLQTFSAQSGGVLSQNASSFLSFDIREGLLKYQHDDSETFSDQFSFLASADYYDSYGDARHANYSGTVNITIELKNDHRPVRIVNKVFKAIKGGKTLLTNDVLKYHDEDSDFDDRNIRFMRRGIRNGDLVWTENEKQSVYQFYQRDLEDGNLLFKHQGDILNSRVFFTVFDNDQVKYETGFLLIEAFEPFLNIVNNTGIAVNKGGSVSVSSTNLSCESNLNIKKHNLVYLVTVPPSFGMLLANGVETRQFSEEDLMSGRIMYMHDNSFEIRDSFNFTVQGRDLTNSSTFSIRIYLTDQQTLPNVTKNEVLFAEEGRMTLITRNHLTVNHVNHPAIEIVYSVITPPLYGYLRLNLNALVDIYNQQKLSVIPSSRPPQERLESFTQLDVNRRRLVYVQNSPGHIEDAMLLNVTNGFTSINVTLQISIVPNIVPVSAKNLTVKEGMARVILMDSLRVIHPYYQDVDFDVFITVPPQHGIIEMTSSTGVNVSQFSTLDVQNEFIYYIHDGSDTARDGFKFVMNSSETSARSDEVEVFITIIQVNDEPPIVTAKNRLTAFYGIDIVISTFFLSASDPDTPSSNLTFHIDVPTNGRLFLQSDLTTPVQEFTQKDLEESRVIYRQSGARTGGFRFHVSDGIHSTLQQIFIITTQTLRLILANNTQLYATPTGLIPVTTEHLNVLTNEDPPSNLSRPIIFDTTKEPEHGQIVKVMSREIITRTMSYKKVNRFTQDDIDSGAIFYKHVNRSGSVYPQEDSAIFSVFLSLAENLTSLTLSITIDEKSPLSGAADDKNNDTIDIAPLIFKHYGAEVDEGGTVDIPAENFDPYEIFSLDRTYDVKLNITDLPQHGILSEGDRALKRFEELRMNSFPLRYVHDHSDEREDWFNFTVSQENDPRYAEHDGQFLIRIRPVNDQTFHFETLSFRMDVNQGTSQPITAEYLKAVDADNFPNEIVYELFSQPSNGRLTSSLDHDTLVKTFTQEDINEGHLIFHHDGGTNIGTFLFQITDGFHRQMRQFYINIIPRVIQVQRVIPMTIKQGDSYGIITPENVNISTNGEAHEVKFNVSIPPQFGEITVNGSISDQFSYQSLAANRVRYHQTNFSSAEDFMGFVAYDELVVTETINVTLVVESVLLTSPFFINSGSLFPINASVVNASNLSNEKLHHLLCTVKEKGLLGEVVEKVNKSLTSIQRFPWKDALENVIYFKADRMNLLSNETMHDYLSLEFSGPMIQPSISLINVTIGPQLSSTTTAPPDTSTISTIHAKISSERKEPNFISSFGFGTTRVMTTVPTSNYTYVSAAPVRDINPFLFIIPLFLILLLIILIILFIVYRRYSAKGKSEKDNAVISSSEPPVIVQTAAVPQVHVIANPNTQTDSRHNSVSVTQPTINRPQLSPLVPQVKVTPLGRPPSPKNSYATLTSNGSIPGAPSVASSAQSAVPGAPSGSLAYNWDGCDPELMEHLSSTNPTLKHSQYWV